MLLPSVRARSVRSRRSTVLPSRSFSTKPPRICSEPPVKLRSDALLTVNCETCVLAQVEPLVQAEILLGELAGRRVGHGDAEIAEQVAIPANADLSAPCGPGLRRLLICGVDDTCMRHRNERQPQ